MRKKIRYQCMSDLQQLRLLSGLTKFEVADQLNYDVRTLERIENENATVHEEDARQLAQLYGFDFDEYFVCIDKNFSDLVKKLWLDRLKVEIKQDIYEGAYYFIFIRKVGWYEDYVLGEGKWCRDYNRNKEIRTLRAYNGTFLHEQYPKVSIINTRDEWRYWHASLTVGKMYKVIVNEKCMQSCMPECMKEHCVKKDYLAFKYDNIMPWGINTDYIRCMKSKS